MWSVSDFVERDGRARPHAECGGIGTHSVQGVPLDDNKMQRKAHKVASQYPLAFSLSIMRLRLISSNLDRNINLSGYDLLSLTNPMSLQNSYCYNE